MNHFKSYLTACLLAVAAALIVVCSLPKEYAAQVKVANEYVTYDMKVGLQDIASWMNYKTNTISSIEDMNTYCQILSTTSFAEKMAQVTVPAYSMSYADYLREHHRRPWWEGKKEVEELILDNIQYNLSQKYSTLTIQVTDQDPVVAAQMADSVRVKLHEEIARQKKAIAQNEMEHSYAQRAESKEHYEKAREAYETFADTHQDISSKSELAKAEYLEDEKQKAYDVFSKASIQYYRDKALYRQEPHFFSLLQRATVPLSPTSPSVMGYLLAFLVIAVVITKWWIMGKEAMPGSMHFRFADSFSPWMITIAVWAGLLFLFQFQKDVLYPLGSRFYTCLALWLPIFVASSIITFITLPHPNAPVRSAGSRPVEANLFVFNILYAVSIVITPLYLFQIMKFVMMFDMENLLYNIRMFAVYGDTSYGILNYSLVINQTLLLVALWLYPRIPRWQLITVFFANILSCFAIMEKGGILLMCLSTMFVLFEKGYIKIRTIAIVGVVIVVFFFFMNLARTDQSDTEEMDMTFIDFFAIYVLSPPVAFERVMRDLSTQFGSHTFEVVYVLLNKFGMGHFEINSKLQEFVWVPLPTNVYTIFQPFYQDFGYKGVAFFAFIYGTVSGWAYRMFRNGSAMGRCLYTYFIYILIMQFYQENIMLSLVFFIQLLFFLFLMTQNRISLTLRPTSTRPKPDTQEILATEPKP